MSGKSREHGLVAVLRCKKLKAYVQSIFEDLKLKGIVDSDHESVTSLLFSGDKGGEHMKFHFEVVIGNHSIVSVCDVHIFAMYKGSDCAENMEKVIASFQTVLREIQADGFRLDGHRVKVFLGGDFCFLDSCLGHQGSSSTFPCVKWDVKRDHLQHHGTKPHTPNDCPEIGRRTIEDIESLYCENLAEDRQLFDARATGKFHGNFYNRAIFPILSLDNIVPPVLHIMLGVILKLFNLLLSRCREIDQQQVDSPTHKAALEANETAWERKRAELLEL